MTTHTHTKTHVRTITVTGVDEKTHADAIRELLDEGAEVGFLWTETPEGRNRYPALGWIMNAATELFENTTRLALHVCGRGARARLLASGNDMNTLVAFFDRVQINGVVTPDELRAACNLYGNSRIITQHRPENIPLLKVREENHEILVDASGGRGIAPDSWVHPMTEKQCGFAGGLGPDNLARELKRISAVARDSWWVDMEGKLRDERDRFDAEKALLAVKIFNSFDPHSVGEFSLG